MNIVLFDPPEIRLDLQPLTCTRPVATLRCGILTIAEKWERLTGANVSFLTAPVLTEKFPSVTGPDTVFIDGSLLPDASLVNSITALPPEHALGINGTIAAIRTTSGKQGQWNCAKTTELNHTERITTLWDVFQKNGAQIRADFTLLTAGRTSAPLSDPHTRTYHPENIFLEPGARVLASVINATGGPVYLGRNSIIQEGSVIRGPFALGDEAQLAMGTVIRGDTTIGPGCRAGGEINNAVMISHSNKSHYGYLGNAVIGSWCNLGAGTTASNLANSFGEARLWNYRSSSFIPTGSPFCGLIMGDYSTTAVGTMFNTASSVGPGSKIFGAGFARTYLPPFTRGGSAGLSTMEVEEVITFAERMMARRGMEMPEPDKNILRALHAQFTDLRKLPARKH